MPERRRWWHGRAAGRRGGEDDGLTLDQIIVILLEELEANPDQEEAITSLMEYLLANGL